jgi:hypothetical protein
MAGASLALTATSTILGLSLAHWRLHALVPSTRTTTSLIRSISTAELVLLSYFHTKDLDHKQRTKDYHGEKGKTYMRLQSQCTSSGKETMQEAKD